MKRQSRGLAGPPAALLGCLLLRAPRSLLCLSQPQLCLTWPQGAGIPRAGGAGPTQSSSSPGEGIYVFVVPFGFCD